MPRMGALDNIFLVGPMGAGKSTIGKQLAELCGKEFLDSDQEIEKRTGASISLIFEIEGEPGFRSREAAMIDELTRKTNLVLATGGGAILDEANRRLLRQRGYVVYLHADIDTLVQRTRRDRNRPLLNNGDRRQKLVEIMQVREPLYRAEADLVIDTRYRSTKAVAQEIARHVQSKDT